MKSSARRADEAEDGDEGVLGPVSRESVRQELIEVAAGVLVC